jgi:hypothetical protein
MRDALAALAKQQRRSVGFIVRDFIEGGLGARGEDEATEAGEGRSPQASRCTRGNTDA